MFFIGNVEKQQYAPGDVFLHKVHNVFYFFAIDIDNVYV